MKGRVRPAANAPAKRLQKRNEQHPVAEERQQTVSTIGISQQELAHVIENKHAHIATDEYPRA
jgi:alpha-acetolactate decarboxylase